jgi:hypothetical protein
MRPYFKINIWKIRLNEIEEDLIEAVKTIKIEFSEENSGERKENKKNNNNNNMEECVFIYEDKDKDEFDSINNEISKYSNENQLNNNNNITNNNNLIYSDNFSDNESFNKDTKNNSSIENNEEIKEEKKEEKRFNSIRANFYIKNGLYDLILYQQESNIIIPEKYKIDDKLSGFLYPDDYNTFYFTKCRKLGEEKIINDLDNEETKFTKFNNSLGLYFCGKEIKIENEIKKCAPNEFICKECMRVNKKKYNIKNDCLININGRVAKINEGSYHCFGHFLCGSKGNQIEDCISLFSCKACKMLYYYSKYYI